MTSDCAIGIDPLPPANALHGPTIYCPSDKQALLRSLTCIITSCSHSLDTKMADHQKEIEEFGQNNDFWLFGYG